MATHSSVLAWRIPGMAEPGGLPSMGLHRVGHDWSDLAAAAAALAAPFFFPFNSDSRKVALEMQGVGWGRVLSSGIRCSGVAFPNQQHLETLLRAPTAAPPTVRNPLHFPPTHCPQPQCLLPGSLKTGLRIIQQNVWVFSNSLSDPPQSRIKKDGTGMIVSTLLMKRQAQTG